MESKEKVESSHFTIELDQAKTDELSLTDLVTLNEYDFQIIKSANQNEQNTREIEQWKKELTQLYNTLYDTSKYSKIEYNSFLLTYFEKLKDDATNKELYESLSKIFFGAYEIQKAIGNIKILHSNLNSKLSEIKSRIAMLEPTFKHVVAQSYQKNQNQNDLIERLRLIDPAQIAKCNELIENLQLKQEALKALFTYTQKDRENLAEILGCGMTQLFLDPNLEINLKTLKKAVDDNREILDNIQAQIHENGKLINIERANMEYLQKAMENNEKEIRLLDQELDNLKDNRNSNALNAREDEKIKREETKSKLVSANLEAINNVYNERIEKCNSLRQSILKANKANSEEYKNCEKKLEDLEIKIIDRKREFAVEQIKYDNAETEYKKLIDQCNNSNMKFIESFIKDEAFVNLIIKLKNKYDIEITETQKIHFKNQLIKFLKEFKDLIDDSINLEDRSNKITIEYNEIISMCKDLDTLVDIFVYVVKNETLKSKIWPMFVYRYYDKNINIKPKLERMNDNEKKEILWKILFGKQSNLRTKREKKYQGNDHQKDENVYNEFRVEEENDIENNTSESESSSSSEDQKEKDGKKDNSSSSEDEDDNHYNLRKAFNSIFSFISIEEFFSKNEEELDFCDRFIDIYVEKIDNEMYDIKLQQKEAKKKKTLKLQESLNKEMEKLNKEKRALKREKLKILGLIKEKIKALKEDYYQTRVVFELEKIFKFIDEKHFPKLDAFKYARRQADNDFLKHFNNNKLN